MTPEVFLFSFNSISSEHGISIDPQELAKLCGSTDSDVQVTKEEFMSYAKHSEFFKNQLGKTFLYYTYMYVYVFFPTIVIRSITSSTFFEDKSDSGSMVNKRESAAKAERAFKLFDKDNDGYITKVEFQKISEKLDKSQVAKENVAFTFSFLIFYRG